MAKHITEGSLAIRARVQISWARIEPQAPPKHPLGAPVNATKAHLRSEGNEKTRLLSAPLLKV